MFDAKICAVALITSLALSGPATAQLNNANERTPDAGNPAVPLNPPGVIQPMSGNGVAPLGSNYLGNTPSGSPPSGRTFLSAPGFLPAPRDQTNRAFDRNQGYVAPGVVAILPPASTGRQGLPPQTWALLTPRQQDLHRQAEAGAMSSPLGEGFTWDDANRSGEVRVVADRMYNNRPCRDFVHTVFIDNQRVEGYTTKCR